MAQTNLPSPTKVSGKFNAIYEAYYQGLDTKRSGTIEALVAAKFLKKSGLSDVVLSRIWDLSDPTGRGFLDREGFFVALKLVALAQAGHDIHMRNIFIEPPNPPKVGEVPKIQPPKIITVLPHTQDWAVTAADRLKYEALFESLLPGADGLLPGNKVRSVLMDSKLPLDALSRIWDLADQDKDGSLDRHEFLVAMHLVYLALDKKTIPASLPVELHRPKPMAPPSSSDNGFVANFPSDIAPPPVPPLPLAAAAHIPPLIPPMPMRPAPMSQPPAPLIPTDLLIQTGGPLSQQQPQHTDWVVSPMDKQRFDVMFKRSDLDNDGLVSGLEIKDVFLQSGIPQLCLAQIWALCDTAQSGKLTAEQFALAMWMVERKRMGYEPPECLAPQMVPPSQRPVQQQQQQQQQSQAALLMGGAADLVGLDAGGLMQPTQTAAAAEQAYANPELAMIAKEIEELVRERRQLETEVTQREADIRIKNGEVRSLQSELDTLAATLKQLENQKGEAQKRLDDLKAQTVDYEREREVINEQLRLATEQVNKIRDKCQKQEDTIRDMEGEVDSKRGELQKLKDEESSLEREYDSNKAELDKVSQNLQDTKLQISQIKSMVTQLQENQRQMSDALAICKSAIETNNPTMVSDYTLRLEPEFREVKAALEKKVEKPAELDTSTSEAGFKANGFTPSDPFGASSASTTGAGGFATTFDDSFGGGGFGHQARSSGDAFGSASGVGASSHTGHQLGADPFGDKSGAKAVTPDPNKDDFGSDPFAILHAPTSASQIISPGVKLSAGGAPPRPESPSPALPPKQAKKPPPRPAPPRPTLGPTPTRPEPPSHGFGGSGAAGGFADFANFDDIPSTPHQATSTTTTNIPTLIKPQQSAAIFGSPLAPAPAAGIAPEPISAPVATATTDFVEDPFKDYRYEDPFNIKDPFDDDDDAITDNFASIIAVAPSPITTASTISTTTIVPPSVSLAAVTLQPPAPSTATGTLPKHASPVPGGARVSPSFANFNNQFGASSSAARTSDFFDAFHDNFNRNTGSNSGSANSINATATAGTTANSNSNGNTTPASASASSIDLAFGGVGGGSDFDPFGVPKSTSVGPSNNDGTLKKPPGKVDNAFAASFNTDFFGGGNGNGNGFEDEFAAQVKVPNASANQPTTSSSSSSNSDFAKFDAFSEAIAGSQISGNNDGFGGIGAASAAADPFGEANFGANFTKPSGSSSCGGATRKNNNNNVANNNLAAATSDLGSVGRSGEKLKNPRYASDYSKGEAAFDKDIEEALQRSLVDQ